MMRKYLTLLLAALLLGGSGSSCSEKWTHHPLPELPENPDKPDDPKPEPGTRKPVVLWVDAEANFSRLRTKADITHYVEMAHQAGFNTLVVDVKPVQGDVLYDSDFLPQCTDLAGGSIPNRGFDYLQHFIDQARRLEMKITVSTTILTMGLTASKTGPAYTDPQWEGKTCIEYLPSGLQDIKQSTDTGNVFCFLNPILPEVRAYVMRMVEEIAAKYDFDGYALDYCRYCNLNSDFSQASKEAFEAYAGVVVQRFPQDIYTFNADNEIVSGKHYNQWVEWRASIIQDYVTEIGERLRKIKPKVSLELWAASWWPLPHTGQNWASPYINEASSKYWWATPAYDKTGFADQLSVFQLGSYLDRVYGPNDPESVEYAIARAKRLLAGDCKLYGTVSSANRNFDIENAVHLCLTQTDGVMVFELSHIINSQHWEAIRKGVERAEKDLGIQPANTK